LTKGGGFLQPSNGDVVIQLRRLKAKRKRRMFMNFLKRQSKRLQRLLASLLAVIMVVGFMPAVNLQANQLATIPVHSTDDAQITAVSDVPTTQTVGVTPLSGTFTNPAGGTIGPGSVLTIGANINGTIDVNGGTLYLNSDDFTLTGSVTVRNGGTFNMSAGTINRTSGVFAGVHLRDGGTFNMTGGTVMSSTNRVWVRYGSTFNMHGGTLGGTSGRGVLVTGASTFNMYGGHIYRGSSQEGAGALVEQESRMYMHGGTISHSNNAFRGGGVYVRSNGHLYMAEGATISHNRAGQNEGGGVRVDNATFIMSGGVISDNTANMHGGGVYLRDGSHFYMSGNAIIRNNTSGYPSNPSNGHGGGLAITRESVATLSGNATISENSSIGRGAGVAVVAHYTTLNMLDNAQIIGNTTSMNAGGVLLSNNSLFNMYGGLIAYNRAANGGGIAAPPPLGPTWAPFELNIHGGEIRDNTLTASGTPINRGGGIYLTGSTASVVNITGGVIKNNEAQFGGGIFMTSGGSWSPEFAGNTVVISGGTIENNTAHTFGGGVFYDLPVDYDNILPRLTIGSDVVMRGNVAPNTIINDVLNTANQNRIQPSSWTTHTRPVGSPGLHAFNSLDIHVLDRDYDELISNTRTATFRHAVDGPLTSTISGFPNPSENLSFQIGETVALPALTTTSDANGFEMGTWNFEGWGSNDWSPEVRTESFVMENLPSNMDIYPIWTFTPTALTFSQWLQWQIDQAPTNTPFNSPTFDIDIAQFPGGPGPHVLTGFGTGNGFLVNEGRSVRIYSTNPNTEQNVIQRGLNVNVPGLFFHIGPAVSGSVTHYQNELILGWSDREGTYPIHFRASGLSSAIRLFNTGVGRLVIEDVHVCTNNLNTAAAHITVGNSRLHYPYAGLIINGGVFENGRGSANPPSGSIIGEAAVVGVGINGRATINGGTFRNNTGSVIADRDNTGEITINGGYFYNNHGNSNGGGGSVVRSHGALRINGGTFTNNSALFGGAVLVEVEGRAFLENGGVLTGPNAHDNVYIGSNVHMSGNTAIRGVRLNEELSALNPQVNPGTISVGAVPFNNYDIATSSMATRTVTFATGTPAPSTHSTLPADIIMREGGTIAQSRFDLPEAMTTTSNSHNGQFGTWHFDGWSVPNLSGTREPGSMVQMPVGVGDFNIIGVWRFVANDNRTATFAAGTGNHNPTSTAPANITAQVGANFTLPVAMTSYSTTNDSQVGTWAFTGWNVAGTTHNAGAVIEMPAGTGNLNVVAVWEFTLTQIGDPAITITQPIPTELRRPAHGATSTASFTAELQNAPAGATVQWVIDNSQGLAGLAISGSGTPALNANLTAQPHATLGTITVRANLIYNGEIIDADTTQVAILTTGGGTSVPPVPAFLSIEPIFTPYIQQGMPASSILSIGMRMSNLNNVVVRIENLDFIDLHGAFGGRVVDQTNYAVYILLTQNFTMGLNTVHYVPIFIAGGFVTESRPGVEHYRMDGMRVTIVSAD